jgi:4-hydroxybenzoate polyprenyltransferase
MPKFKVDTDKLKQRCREFASRGRACAARLRAFCLALYGEARRRVERHWPGIRRRLSLYARLTRMHRPIGTLLLLWPTLWALWIAAEGPPTPHLLLVFVLGTFLTRSAGVAINDTADRNIDPYVARTVDRPLATGEVSPREALAVAAVLLLAAFGLVLTTNRFTVLLSLAAIPIIAIYPFMKRHTYIPQFVLGVAFSWGIPMAFAAQLNELTKITGLLFIANLLWTVIFDTIYAMVDREHDLKIGVKSTAILFADADRAFIGIMQAMMLIVLVIIGLQLKLEMFYNLALLLVAGFMIYHQYLIKDRDEKQCFRAFLNNNWLGATVFAGIFLSYL